MKNAFQVVVALLLSGCDAGGAGPIARGGSGGSSGAGDGGEPEIAHPMLARGINFGSALDAPVEGEWAPPLSNAHFSFAKASGFDHIRLPVRFSSHTGPAPEYLIAEALLARVDWALERAQSEDLSLIIDLHHFEELHADPFGEKARFLAIWKQLSERYQSASETVYFELLNEPSQKLDTEWNQLLAEALSVVRETNPERWVIVDGPHYADPDKLAALIPPPDPHVIASFHFYKPLPFAVQGSPWMSAEYGTTGVVFPGPPPEPLIPTPQAQATAWVAQFFKDYNAKMGDQNPCSESSLRTYFDEVRRFASLRKVPLYLGEFAALDFADATSRANWLRSVVKISEEYQIPWAYWDDAGHNQGMILDEEAWVPEVHQGLFGTPAPE